MTGDRAQVGPSTLRRLQAIRRVSPLAAWRRRAFPFAAPTPPTGIAPTPVEPKLGVYYDSEWARGGPARTLRAGIRETLLLPAIATIASPRVEGLDRLAALDEDDVAIFVSNHHSHLDSSVLMRTIPRPWRRRLVIGAAADYFYRTRTLAAVTSLSLNTIPIDRRRASRVASDRAEQVLADGWNLVLYPEGGRSLDGWGQEFRAGAAWLAMRVGVPIVPVHISGTGRILPKGARVPRRQSVTVNFGRPLRPGPDEDRRAFTARIEATVAELGDESATDWWSARRRAVVGGTTAHRGPDASEWRRAWALEQQSDARRRPSWPELG